MRSVNFSENLTQKAKKFELLYHQYYDEVFRHTIKLTGDDHLAKEIIQQVFIRCWEKDVFYRELRIGSYLCRACTNAVADYKKTVKQERQKKQDFVATQQMTGEQKLPSTLSTEERVLLALFRLPEQWQKVLFYKYYKNLKNHEVVQIMHKTKTRHDQLLRDGKTRLREYF